jgi:hypothetical protein
VQEELMSAGAWPIEQARKNQGQSNWTCEGRSGFCYARNLCRPWIGIEKERASTLDNAETRRGKKVYRMVLSIFDIPRTLTEIPLDLCAILTVLFSMSKSGRNLSAIMSAKLYL